MNKFIASVKTVEEPMEVTVKLLLTPDIVKLFPQMSIERVINTTLNIVGNDDCQHEDSLVNFDDWQDLKLPIVSLFECIKDAIARKRYNDQPQREPWLVAKFK